MNSEYVDFEEIPNTEIKESKEDEIIEVEVEEIPPRPQVRLLPLFDVIDSFFIGPFDRFNSSKF